MYFKVLSKRERLAKPELPAVGSVLGSEYEYRRDCCNMLLLSNESVKVKPLDRSMHHFLKSFVLTVVWPCLFCDRRVCSKKPTIMVTSSAVSSSSTTLITEMTVMTTKDNGTIAHKHK